MRAEDGERVTCDGRLFHIRAAVTGNALSLTVDRRVHRTCRVVDEAERNRCLDSVYTGTLAPNHVDSCMPDVCSDVQQHNWSLGGLESLGS